MDENKVRTINGIKIEVDTRELDAAIVKAERLVDLLQQADNLMRQVGLGAEGEGG
ncbi:hypothetical protein [Paenibacillus caseinilyticus]|uniref:hypothetical protein n=1 Tax=Paenibacillus caseinilyticus TaxID=3098138 RepID=UPI0022B91742|nr:hypothetical protein [Paenibacillus caseinilyticus]MCZ8518873.1 hypothetical protein [Paenibacillus caseinilyticus]